MVADLDAIGERVLLARGGNGGFGNTHFKSSTNRAPRRANPGQAGRGALALAAAEADRRRRPGRPAQCRQIDLPRRGLRGQAEDRRLSLHHAPSRPRRGRGADGREFVIADIPGLIEGAHEGAGLGDRFLGHVERCRVLLHLVDGTGEDPAEAYRTVRDELDAYGHGLDEKPEIVALSQGRRAVARERSGEGGKALAKAAGRTPLVLSAVSGEGVEQALQMLAREIAAAKSADPNEVPAEKEEAWRPLSACSASGVRRQYWLLAPRRWIASMPKQKQLNVRSDEAYEIASRLSRRTGRPRADVVLAALLSYAEARNG